MGIHKLLAVLLIAAGCIALVYGGFTYTKATHEADLGPISLSVDEQERVTVPLWAGIASIAAGVVLLLLRKSS